MRREDGTVRKLCRRYNIPGHAHELTFSCYHGLPLLGKERSRLWFLESLAQARQKHSLQLFAYVVMPEHAHVLLYAPDDNYDIPAILKSIKQPVARRAMNYLREAAPDWLENLGTSRPDGKTVYHFWQDGGGYDRNIHSADAIISSIEYLHANPVRRGLVASPTDWEWSSARWWEGQPSVRLEMDNLPADAL